MSEKQSTNNPSSNDELDLRQFFNMIGNGLDLMFKKFLRLFLYLKRRAVILVILAVIGVVTALALNQIVTERLKIEVIVKPNLESKGYLYDVVDEIQANLDAKDTTFFSKIGLDITNLDEFQITVQQIQSKVIASSDLEYLELLEKFQDNGLVSDIIRTEILNKSSLEHKITFFFKSADDGQEFASKVMEYINSNDYYTELTEINRNNAEERINQDEVLLKQIDDLILKYSDKMTKDRGNTSDQRIILDSENELDIAELFKLKNTLIRDIETKRIELGEQKETINVINFGEPQKVRKSLIGNRIVFIPLLLIVIFFLIDLTKYINRKSKEIEG